MKDYLDCFQKIHIHQIDEGDTLFDWASQETSSTLHQSFEKDGLLNPISIHKKSNEKYMIIDGFKRFHWMSQKKISPIPCLIFYQDISIKELILWKLKSHSFENLPCLQIFQILDLLEQHDVAQNEIVQILPCFGLPASLQRFHQIRRLKKTIQDNQEFFKMYHISDLLVLLPLKAEDINAVGRIFKNFTIGGNKFKSTVKLLNDTAKLMQLLPHELLAQKEVRTIMENTELDNATKFKHFKCFLEEKRYPEQTATQKKNSISFKTARTSKKYKNFL